MSLQIRRGIESQRTNIVPAVGELLYTTDSNKLYVGDGHTAGGNNILASSAGAGLSWNGTQLVVSGSGLNLSTDVVSEGTTRQYFTIPRAQAAAAAMFTATGSPAVTGTVTGLTSPNLVTLSSSTGLVALEPFIVTGAGGSAYGLAPGTYYVVNPNAGSNQITLASSLANAQAGTAIQTFTTGAPNSVTFSAGGPDSNITFTYNPTAGTISANVQVATIGITSIQQDHSPALGGDLGLNGHSISGTGSISNTGNIVNTGNISTTGTITSTTGLGANLILNTFNITGYGSINTTGNISTTGNQSATGTITATTGLGGNLPLNSYGITGTGSINISGAITGTSLSAGVGTISGGALSITTLNASTGLGANLALNGYNITGTGNISNQGNITASAILQGGTIIATTGLGGDLLLNSQAIGGTGSINITGPISGTTLVATSGLGGNLSLNNHNISGAGNINITGTITSSGAVNINSLINISATGYITSTIPAVSNYFTSASLPIGTASNPTTIVGTADRNFALFTGLTDGTAVSGISTRISRGTLASPAVVHPGDFGSFSEGLVYDGSNYLGIGAFGLFVDPSTTVTSGKVYGGFAISVTNPDLPGGTAAVLISSRGVLSAPVIQTGLYNTSSYPSNPVKGMIIFDQQQNHFYGFNGSLWVAFTGP